MTRPSLELVCAVLLCSSPWNGHAQQASREDRGLSADTLADKSEALRPRSVNAGLNVENGTSLDLMVSTSYGNDSSVNNIPGLSSQFNSLQARLALGLRTRRSSMTLAHDGTVLLFPGSDIALQQYQVTSFNLTHAISRVTTLGFNVTNSYGADSVRATGSVSLAAVNTQPIDNSDVLAAVVTGKTLRQSGGVVLDHEISATRAFTIGGGGSFNNFLGAGASNDQFNLNGAYRQYYGPHLLVGARAEGSQQNFGSGTCTTANLTGFAALRITSNLRVDGSVGPAFGSAQCTGQYQFEAIVSQQTVRGTRVYVGTSRHRGNGSVTGSLWETSGYGGMEIGNPRKFTFSANGGYTNYHGGTASLASDVTGYFVAGTLRRQIGFIAEAALTMRHFQRTASSVDLSRTLFFATFTCCAQSRGSNGK
ncbi:hypothetical protein Terro_1252 [Terriglobus roseus DSM 18391]|uniref:Uncharacterized protein n=1 Tax=Terriglobus roseus (strain DSM 18391 / NRRL B-41598 / KBS 63) TaxID=926566 RepID=I3ZE94_TERRK|nr:hypothetical protein [Terriglobus roseus]AFL87562.1 hypothetical protein Terro_1252 [Terriglobus roseus DSM 18391]